jgi:hypothetical protein
LRPQGRGVGRIAEQDSGASLLLIEHCVGLPASPSVSTANSQTLEVFLSHLGRSSCVCL